MIKKKYLPELSIVRAIAILAVVMIHSTSNAVATVQQDSMFYSVYLFLNKFSSFAVPLFIFLSGFVLIYSYMDKPFHGGTLKTFYQKRLDKILLPYIVFSLFYFTLRHIKMLDFSLVGKFINSLLLGTAYTHLYYIFVIVQFYIIFPILLYFTVKSKRSAFLLFVAGFVLQWAYFYFNREVLVGIDNLPSLLKRTGSLFISYLAYFTLGTFLATQYSHITNWLDKKRMASYGILTITGLIWLGAGVYYVYLYYMGNIHSEWRSTPHITWTWFIFNTFSALFLVLLSSRIVERLTPSLQKTFHSLGDASFGIFLIHPFILYCYRQIPVSGNSLLFHAYYAGQFLTALLVSWFITWFIIRYFKFSWIILGSSRK